MAKRKDPNLDAQLAAYTERQHIDLLGCTTAEYREHVGQPHITGSFYHEDHPASKYLNQRAAAARRGIHWEFNFIEWWSVWRDSGKWKHRGRSVDQYVMGRYGDVGAYHPGNVYICLAAQNHADKARWAKARKEAKKDA